VDLTNVKSGVMSRTGGSARAEGVCRWRKGGVAGGRSRVGHGNVLSLWWTYQRKRSRSRSRTELELDIPAGVGLCRRPDKGSGRTETGVATNGRYRSDTEELDCGSVCRKTGVSPEGGDGHRDRS